jgi:ABC-2 type transport system ATP-binding protein
MPEHDAGGSVPALRTECLGRRYGKVWGLRDCTLEVPAGAVAALVGPNGAGKTTLLEMIIGLLEPTEGQVSVFGETSHADTAETLARVGYVAQDHPLYRDFTVADMFHLGRSMNPSWDQQLAAARMDALGIPLKRKVKRLSGGQQAQVSLTMALAKRAPLLVLDEPVSSLDPIARLDFMRDVMASAADADLTFLISSHVVSELERFCDWLIVLAHGHVQLAGRPTTYSAPTGCSPSRAPPRTPSCPARPFTAPTATGIRPCWSAPILSIWLLHRRATWAALSSAAPLTTGPGRLRRSRRAGGAARSPTRPVCPPGRAG